MRAKNLSNYMLLENQCEVLWQDMLRDMLCEVLDGNWSLDLAHERFDDFVQAYAVQNYGLPTYSDDEIRNEIKKRSLKAFGDGKGGESEANEISV
jgi:hypothetical protein